MESKKKYGAIALCLIIGFLATKSTELQSSMFGRVVMGGPMVALLVSMIICNIIPTLDKDFKEGTTFSSKKFLNWGIILTGGTLSFAAIFLFDTISAFSYPYIAPAIGFTDKRCIFKRA